MEFEDIIQIILITTLIITLMFAGLYVFKIIEHNPDCTCTSCYEPIGKINGIVVYKGKDNSMYYRNELTYQYQIIVESDGTKYTFQEYSEDYQNDIANKVREGMTDNQLP